MLNIFKNLSLIDYALAFIAAALIMQFIKKITKTRENVKKRPVMLLFPPIDFAVILRRCHKMFPNESLNINGTNFYRGMNVRVTTNENKIFEGQLIGHNNDNIYCVLTKTAIATDDLGNVADMAEITELGGL